MRKVSGEMIPIQELLPNDKKQMLALMENYFLNVTGNKFENDLGEKERVILLRDENNSIVGFSTVKLMRVEVFGREVVAIFSGDTVVDKSCWGERALVKKLGEYFIEVIEENPESYCCWYLISKGYKTYRYLPLYFHEFYPGLKKVTPIFEQKIIKTLSEKKYPGKYNQKTGVINFNSKAECLREGIAEVTQSRLKDPHVSFFVLKNPGHANGNELACIGLLTKENLTKTFYKIVTGINFSRKEES